MQPQLRPSDARPLAVQLLRGRTGGMLHAHSTAIAADQCEGATGELPHDAEAPQPPAAQARVPAAEAGSKAAGPLQIFLDHLPYKPPVGRTASVLGPDVLSREINRILAASGMGPTWRATSDRKTVRAACQPAARPQDGKFATPRAAPDACLSATQQALASGSHADSVPSDMADVISGRTVTQVEVRAVMRTGLVHMYPQRHTLEALYPDWDCPERWLPDRHVQPRLLPANEVRLSNCGNTLLWWPSAITCSWSHATASSKRRGGRAANGNQIASLCLFKGDNCPVVSIVVYGTATLDI